MAFATEANHIEHASVKEEQFPNVGHLKAYILGNKIKFNPPGPVFRKLFPIDMSFITSI